LLRLIRDKKDLSTLDIRNYIEPAFFVPPNKKVDDMFDFFKAQGTGTAIVLGEDGGVMGVITLKDVLEFTFGGIAKELAGQAFYTGKGQEEFVVPGNMNLMDFDQLTSLGIKDDRMTTIGGFVFGQFGQVPHVGDSIRVSGLTFQIQEMDGNRIKTLHISASAPVAPPPAHVDHDGEAHADPQNTEPDSMQEEEQIPEVSTTNVAA
jgi:CBS domain containing-hemolysin-like protein